MMMDIKQLKHFLAAAETGSFTRGASLANISQPALSASIAKLEAELECHLFVRNKRNVVLTPEGRHLKHSADHIVAEVDALKRRFRKRTSSRILRILASNSFPAGYLGDLLKGFAIATPHVHFDVSDTGPVNRLDPKDDRIFDMIFSVSASGSDNSALQDKKPIDWGLGDGRSDMQTFLLKEDVFGVALPENHPFASRNSMCLQDLQDEPFIARMQCEMRPQMEAWMREKGVEFQVRYRTDQDGRALAMVGAGLGITIASMSEEPQKGVTFLPFRGHKWKRSLYAHVPHPIRSDVEKEVLTLMRSLSA
jgi:DNA-binding transcriptional LysR family regulator